MEQQATSHGKTTEPRPSLWDLTKVLLRLGPKQISDEIQLAIAQLKSKGIAAGIAAAIMAVGAVFLAFLVVALIAALIAVFEIFFVPWAAALIVAGIFLVIAVILLLVGLGRLKKALPLVPEDALRGLRLDLGYMREGASFDPASLDRADEIKRKQKQEASEHAAQQKRTPGEGKPKKPSYRELLRRTALRREHIGTLQEDVVSRLPMRREDTQKDAAVGTNEEAGDATATDSAEQTKQFLAQRWKPLSVAAGSAAAGAVFLRELIRK